MKQTFYPGQIIIHIASGERYTYSHDFGAWPALRSLSSGQLIHVPAEFLVHYAAAEVGHA